MTQKKSAQSIQKQAVKGAVLNSIGINASGAPSGEATAKLQGKTKALVDKMQPLHAKIQPLIDKIDDLCK